MNITDTSSIIKSLSTASVDSATSVTSEDLNVPEIYTHAPHDIYGVDDEVGRIRVVKEGETLPKEKWKLKKNSDVALKFRWENLNILIVVEGFICRVSAMLEVTVINRKNMAQPTEKKGPGMTSTPKKKGADDDQTSLKRKPEFGLEVISLRDVEDDEKDDWNENDGKEKDGKENEEVSKISGLKFKSKQAWLSNLRSHFVEIAVDGLEISLRDKVSEKIKQKKKLTPKENMSLIHSINHHIFKWTGPQTPDSSLTRYVFSF